MIVLRQICGGNVLLSINGLSGHAAVLLGSTYK
jgi:hypothetical protein